MARTETILAKFSHIDEYGVAAKALERLFTGNSIKRISTGVFYKPKKTIFGELKGNKKKYLVKYALNYPPRARALLGAILESIGKKEDLFQLKQSLNPLTTFTLAMTQEIFPNSKKWYIQ